MKSDPWEIRQGDALSLARSLEPGSIDCCVTSPPYWGLRDYGVDGQLGLEATPTEYVHRMAELFEAIRVAMKDTGTLWLNLGDSYSVGGTTPDKFERDERADGERGRVEKVKNGLRARPKTKAKAVDGLKPKDLVGIPWRVAFALRDAGWYLRGDIIWAKPNPMPESVEDRPVRSHEFIFQLSKRERYFYDANATREPHKSGPNMTNWWGDGAFEETDVASRQVARPGTNGVILSAHTRTARPSGYVGHPKGKASRSVWTIPTRPFAGAHFAVFPFELARRCVISGCPKGGLVLDPFCGSGTTAIASLYLGRRFLGFELNEEFIQLAKKRIGANENLFVDTRAVVDGSEAPPLDGRSTRPARSAE